MGSGIHIIMLVCTTLLLVPTCHAQNVSRLLWGALENSPTTQASSYTTVLNTARTAPVFTAVPKIDGSAASNTASSRIPTLVQTAICAKYAKDQTCIANVIQGLSVWVYTYNHSFTPSEEIVLYPWIQAYDLMRPFLLTNLTAENITQYDAFLTGFITSADGGVGTAPDMYKTQRYLLRAYASVILNNETEIDTSKQLLEALVPGNILNGGDTYDYNYRDSLAMHMKVVIYWLQIATQLPNMLSTAALRRVETAVHFIRPFVNGSATKIEYQNSQLIPSDNTNKANAVTWVNTTSYAFLLQADILFPSVYAWTAFPPAIPRTSFTLNNVLFGAWRLYFGANPIFTDITSSTWLGSTSALTTTSVPVQPILSTTMSRTTSAQAPFNRSSQLIWGNITHSNLSSYLLRVVKLGKTTALSTFPAIPVIYYMTALPGTTEYINSQAVTSSVNGLLPVAFCARYDGERNCTESVKQGLMAWATTYIPTGKPIDESLLIPWIQSYDIMRPILTQTMNSSDIQIMDKFLLQLVIMGDTFQNPPVPDNHITWRLAIRALAASVLADQALLNSTRSLIDAHVTYDLFSDGSSYDFTARDALFYHVYNLRAWMTIVLQVPQVLSPTTLALIEATVNFIQPYYEGTLVHIEFLNTKVTYDITRKNLGLAEFQNALWVPSAGAQALELARVAFPSVYAWAGPSSVPSSAYSLTLLTTGAWQFYFNSFPLTYNVSLNALTSAPASTSVDYNGDVYSTSMLVWGPLDAVTLTTVFSALMKTAKTTTQIPFTSVQVIDSAVPASKTATDRMATLPQVAICTKFTRDVNCTAAVIQGLTVWIGTYQHTGYPVNENLFIPWIQSYDLVKPILVTLLNSSVISALDNFTKGFITAGDAYVSLYPDTYRTNRFLIRGFAAVTLNNQEEIARTMTLIENHARVNLFSNGTSYDYMTRGALQFHVQNLRSWVQLAAQAPSLLPTWIERLIEANLNFVQPYFKDLVPHVEKTTNLPWVYTTAQPVLAQAENVFPTVYAWTSQSIMNRSAYSLTVLTQGATKIYFTQNPLFSVNSATVTSLASVTTTPQALPGPPRLIWGNITAANVSGSLSGLVKLAKVTALSLFPAVPTITYEGVLPTDPDYIATKVATIRLPDLLQVAICARYTAEPNCTRSVIQGLMVWATTYTPTGNPINENLLIPWIQSYDLMRPILVLTMNSSAIQTMDNFLTQLVTAGDSFINNPDPNNHITWRLCIRSLASTVLGDQGLMDSSSALIDQHVLYDLFSDGSSFDFYARDALYYHIYNLRAWLGIVLQAPQILSPLALALIEASVNFVRPYYDGTLTHIEFLHTKVTFDVQRLNAGMSDFQNVAWEPSKGVAMLELARVVFPSVKAWAGAPFVPSSTYSLTILTTGAWRMYFEASPLPSSMSLVGLTSLPGTTPVDPYAGVTTQSALIWGPLDAVLLAGTSAALVRLAKVTAQSPFPAVQVVDSAVTLSKTATDKLANLPQVAICTKLTRDVNCTASVIQGLTVWANLYVHTGDPVTEILFIPWIQSYDLVKPILVTLLDSSQIASLDIFTRLFITRGDTYYVGPFPDNYQTSRLAIRGFAAVALDDGVEMVNTIALIENHATLNMFSDGTSYDYRARDAFQYHIQNLRYWNLLAMQCPSLLPTRVKTLIEANANFVRPYFQGSVKIEFLNSSYTADASRKALGVAWVPSSGQSVVVQSEVVFPSVYAWTSVSSINRSSYSLTVLTQGALKLYFAKNPIYGATSTAVATTTRAASITGRVTSSSRALSTARPTTPSPVVYRIVITISLAVPVETFTPEIQQGLKEVFAIAVGLTREESYRVELIIRTAARRRLLASNESVVDGIITMPNASSASAGAGQLTNTTLNTWLAGLGLPPASILGPPVVVTALPDTTAPAPIEQVTTNNNQSSSSSSQSGGLIQYIIVQQAEGGIGFYIVSGTVLLGAVAVLLAGIGTFCGNGTQIFRYYFYYNRPKRENRREIPVPIQPAVIPAHHGYDRVPTRPDQPSFARLPPRAPYRHPLAPEERPHYHSHYPPAPEERPHYHAHYPPAPEERPYYHSHYPSAPEERPHYHPPHPSAPEEPSHYHPSAPEEPSHYHAHYHTRHQDFQLPPHWVREYS